MHDIWQFITNEAWPGLAVVWVALYLPEVTILCAPIVWISRRNIAWKIDDALILLAPFVVWSSLFVADADDKSFGNIWYEPLIIGILAPIALSFRVIARSNLHRMLVMLPSLILSCAAAAVWAFVPEIRLPQ